MPFKICIWGHRAQWKTSTYLYQYVIEVKSEKSSCENFIVLVPGAVIQMQTQERSLVCMHPRLMES